MRVVPFPKPVLRSRLFADYPELATLNRDCGGVLLPISMQVLDACLRMASVVDMAADATPKEKEQVHAWIDELDLDNKRRRYPISRDDISDMAGPSASPERDRDGDGLRNPLSPTMYSASDRGEGTSEGYSAISAVQLDDLKRDMTHSLKRELAHLRGEMRRDFDAFLVNQSHTKPRLTPSVEEDEEPGLPDIVPASIRQAQPSNVPVAGPSSNRAQSADRPLSQPVARRWRQQNDLHDPSWTPRISESANDSRAVSSRGLPHTPPQEHPALPTLQSPFSPRRSSFVPPQSYQPPSSQPPPPTQPQSQYPHLPPSGEAQQYNTAVSLQQGQHYPAPNPEPPLSPEQRFEQQYEKYAAQLQSSQQPQQPSHVTPQRQYTSPPPPQQQYPSPLPLQQQYTSPPPPQQQHSASLSPEQRFEQQYAQYAAQIQAKQRNPSPIPPPQQYQQTHQQPQPQQQYLPSPVSPPRSSPMPVPPGPGPPSVPPPPQLPSHYPPGPPQQAGRTPVPTSSFPQNSFPQNARPTSLVPNIPTSSFPNRSFPPPTSPSASSASSLYPSGSFPTSSFGSAMATVATSSAPLRSPSWQPPGALPASSFASSSTPMSAYPFTTSPKSYTPNSSRSVHGFVPPVQSQLQPRQQPSRQRQRLQTGPQVPPKLGGRLAPPADTGGTSTPLPGNLPWPKDFQKFFAQEEAAHAGVVKTLGVRPPLR